MSAIWFMLENDKPHTLVKQTHGYTRIGDFSLRAQSSPRLKNVHTDRMAHRLWTGGHPKLIWGDWVLTDKLFFTKDVLFDSNNVWKPCVTDTTTKPNFKSARDHDACDQVKSTDRYVLG